MSNLAKHEFVAFDISGKNYLSWVLDAEIHPDAKALGDIINKDNTTSSQDKAKAMIFLFHHLHEGLKAEYLTIKDPQILLDNLKDRYDHQKTVILQKARYDWLNLRLQDFKSISEYNSAMFRITSQLKLCGEKITDAEMLEKIYYTFHANNVLLQTQYCEKGFTKYSELISCLLVVEKNNELLIRNHECRPTGSTPFPEANVMTHNEKKSKYKDHEFNYGRGRGRGRGRGFGRGRGGQFKSMYPHQKCERKEGGKQDKGKNDNTTNVCYRCGGTGHWSRTFRTPKHLIEMYQQEKQKRKIETNFVGMDGEDDFANVDLVSSEASDFFTSPEGNN